jgi:hypothetical protein
MKKQDKTIYYLLAAAAAYYAYEWWKGKQAPAIAPELPSSVNNTVIPGQPLTIVESLQTLVDQNTQINPLIETATTYQTFYGQIQGMAPKKVPHSC